MSLSGLQGSTRVLAIRHGRTAWNAATRLQGQMDVALDTAGRWQALQLGKALAGEGIDVVYSSDLQRAVHTAQPVALANGAQLHLHTGLRERGFGVWEGHTYAEIEQGWPEDARLWRRRDPLASPEGGESLEVFSARCVGVASELAARHPGQLIALVAHGGVLDCLYRAATGLDLMAPRSWELGNASINRLLWTPQGFSLVGWDDHQHLLGGEPPGVAAGVD